MEDYAGPATVQALLAARLERQRLGQFQPAGVGGRGRREVRTDIRGDRIAWLEAPLSGAESQFTAGLDALRVSLNRSLMIGLHDVELHFASYAPGCGYVRHLDRSPGGLDRVISVIYYLNTEWKTGDGGELQIETDSGPVLVCPKADTLVLFLSDRFIHAVLPAVRERHSLTGWLHRRT
jgi:SM-20-related protein